MSVLSSLIYRLNAISTKIPASYFVNIDQFVLRFIWKGKIPRIINTILKEKKKVRGQILPCFTTQYKAKEQIAFQ
jgi:hypothetical protein